MNRLVQMANLAGVVILAGLCAVQWQMNRKANLEANRLEKIRLEQFKQIADQEKSIAGCQADLDSFREQIRSTSKMLKETDDKLLAAQRESNQLALERDQLKENVVKWTEAVAARDEQLARSREQIQSLAEDRNQAVTKFNELAEKFNGAVSNLNKRTTDFNELVSKYNALAKSVSESGK